MTERRKTYHLGKINALFSHTYSLRYTSCGVPSLSRSQVTLLCFPMF